jgi:outer membrane protein assembly factor BamB
MKFTPSTGDLVWIEGVTGNVENVVVVDGIAYAGGHFEAYCGAIPGNNFCTQVARRGHLMAVDDATGALLPWHPSANSNLGVFAIAAGPQSVVVGGDFTRLGGVAQQMFGIFKE